ncbi:hypothetical protein [Bacillus atrophaeus]|uniref:hypothetical protein n=1 Tax=Bacillus atrophaeus TaxID=1452 RepID=UPI00404370A0
MSKEDSFWSSMARSAGRLVPGKALGDAAYWQLMEVKIAFRKLGSEEFKLQAIEDIIEQNIKDGMQKLDEMYEKNLMTLLVSEMILPKHFLGVAVLEKVG